MNISYSHGAEGKKLDTRVHPCSWLSLYQALEEATQIHGNRSWKVVVATVSGEGGEVTSGKREWSWVLEIYCFE